MDGYITIRLQLMTFPFVWGSLGVVTVKPVVYITSLVVNVLSSGMKFLHGGGDSGIVVEEEYPNVIPEKAKMTRNAIKEEFDEIDKKNGWHFLFQVSGKLLIILWIISNSRNIVRVVYNCKVVKHFQADFMSLQLYWFVYLE